MLPLLALMIGAYIITKMIALILEKETTAPVAIAAILTVLVTIYSVYSIFTMASNTSNTIKMLQEYQ